MRSFATRQFRREQFYLDHPSGIDFSKFQMILSKENNCFFFCSKSSETSEKLISNCSRGNYLRLKCLTTKLSCGETVVRRNFLQRNLIFRVLKNIFDCKYLYLGFDYFIFYEKRILFRGERGEGNCLVKASVCFLYNLNFLPNMFLPMSKI